MRGQRSEGDKSESKIRRRQAREIGQDRAEGENRAEEGIAQRMTRWRRRGNHAEDEITRKRKSRGRKKNRTEEGGDVDSDLLSSRGNVDSDLKSGSNGMDQNRSDTMTNPTQGLEEKTKIIII